MSRRDVRDPFVAYNAIGGFRGTGFTVVPQNTVLLGAGFYVMVPVLNEQAGDALVDEIKKRAVQPEG
jgi:Na+/pantothenate symporter